MDQGADQSTEYQNEVPKSNIFIGFNTYRIIVDDLDTLSSFLCAHMQSHVNQKHIEVFFLNF